MKGGAVAPKDVLFAQERSDKAREGRKEGSGVNDLNKNKTTEKSENKEDKNIRNILTESFSLFSDSFFHG